MKKLTKEQFLADVASHEMKILRDDGVYRHLRFRSTGEHPWNMWFEIVTWPNALVLRGDMGAWSFSRIDDMFEFFRRGELGINPHYWEEKCESEDRHAGPTRKFSADVFRQAILDRLEDYGLEPDRSPRLSRRNSQESTSTNSARPPIALSTATSSCRTPGKSAARNSPITSCGASTRSCGAFNSTTQPWL